MHHHPQQYSSRRQLSYINNNNNNENSSDVPKMDAWKDDRCRDFIALNTIQRLRSYHSEFMLPIEPINSFRAKNLLLLPKVEPDTKTCNTEDGCAIDTARILFFGPTSFVSLTSQGRMTASPHGGGYQSGSRSSFSINNDDTLMNKINANKGGITRNIVENVEVDKKNNLNESSDRKLFSEENNNNNNNNNNKSNYYEEGNQDAFEAGATPLKRPAIDSVATPAPRPPEGNNQINNSNTKSEEENENRKVEGSHNTNTNNNTVDVVKFSCAIVDAIVSYYQSLLSRGVVLDRFNAKDLAFSWWVVGQNMNVSALNQHRGPLRRDALLIRVQHLYYDLLSETLPKKNSLMDASSHFHTNKDSDDSTKQEEKKSRDENEKKHHHQKQKQKQKKEEKKEEEEENSSNVVKAEEGLKKRPRSRLDPTRMSPPPTSTRRRRKLRSDNENVNNNNNNNNIEKKDTKLSETVSTASMTSTSRTRNTTKQQHQQEIKDNLISENNSIITQCSMTPTLTLDTQKKVISSSSTTTNNNNNNNNNNNIEAESVNLEKPHKSSRNINIEEIWQPLRSTRRRVPPSEDSTDFIESKEIMITEKQVENNNNNNNNINNPCDFVMERIQERMENDSVYATLLSSFPITNKSILNKKNMSCNHDNIESEGDGENDNNSISYGMHPSLMHLLRYYHDETKNTFNSYSEKQQENNEEKEKCYNKLLEKEEEEDQNEENKDKSIVNINNKKEDISLNNNINNINNSKIPHIRTSCPFSELSYPQRCLLTWEASLLLKPKLHSNHNSNISSSSSSVISSPIGITVARRRQPSSRNNNNNNNNNVKEEEENSFNMQKRRYYDYWSNP